jgi:hypothetical protein
MVQLVRSGRFLREINYRDTTWHVSCTWLWLKCSKNLERVKFGITLIDEVTRMKYY